jgi:uncharacterized protein YndB with AHSA1/START domain
LLVTSYRFLTTWLLDAPVEPVWETVKRSEAWPEWWRGVESAVEVRPGDDDGVGSVMRYTWRSVLPYPVRFEAETLRVERPHLIHARASGELAGEGTWRLYARDGETAVTYDWRVGTTRPWMNALAPVARPVFAWNHHVIMRWGGEGLARRLGCRLLAHG